MDPNKKQFPLWLKGIIGLAVVGGGVGVMAMVGTRLLPYLVPESLRTLLTGNKTGDAGAKLTEKSIEELLEKSFKGAGIPIDLNTKTGGVAFKDEQGKTLFGIKGDLPRDFPADIPVFQPSTVAGSMMMGPNKSLQLETDKPLEEVTEFYKSAMAERGWLEDHSAQAFGNQPYTTNWIKGHRQVAIIATPPEDGKTLIIVNVNQPEGQAGDPSLLRVDEKELPGLQKDMQQIIKELDKLQRAPPPEPKAPVPAK